MSRPVTVPVCRWQPLRRGRLRRMLAWAGRLYELPVSWQPGEIDARLRAVLGPEIQVEWSEGVLRGEAIVAWAPPAAVREYDLSYAVQVHPWPPQESPPVAQADVV